MSKAQSAVLWPDDNRLIIEDVEIEDPRADEVLVKLVACGICHTDMVLRDAGLAERPVVLGHEGSGIVEKVGAGVTAFKPGDRVAMSFSSCGECPSCRRHDPSYCHQFFPLNFMAGRPDGSNSLNKGGQTISSHIFGQSSFATRALCPQGNLVKVDESFPLELAGPFGCGFQTGAGAVLNSLKVEEGASVMVLGAGAVGLAAVMAATNIAGADTVIAVDLNDARLELARSVGASHAFNGGADDFDDQVKAVCSGGVDYILDTTGHAPLAERCVDLLAIRGTLGLVAVYAFDATVAFNPVFLVTSGKTIRGILEGDSDIQTFIPRLMAYYQEGLFPVDKLVRYYDFADINEAMKASETGDTIKAIVTMP